MFLTSSIVAGGLFFFLQWNFDRGFLNYINSQDIKRLEKLEEKLTAYYQEEKGWDFIKENHHLWVELHRGLFTPQHQLHGPGKGPKHPEGIKKPPMDRPMDPPGFGQRIILFDPDKKTLIGGGENPGQKLEMVMRPIVYQSSTIGYLGLIPARELSEATDLHFVEQQTEAFALITLIMVIVSILLSFPVAVHLLRPIKHLTKGTQNLIGGKFTTRIPTTTRDELGLLTDHFNILALTLEKNEKARQRWIADISHELRTPLAVLRGEVEAFIDGVRKVGPKSMDPLHREILHLQRLVNDLYELSMSDIGALTYKKIPVNPLGILEGAIEIFEKRFTDKEIKLQATFPDTKQVSLLADPDRLEQLFANLLENSIRYTDSPGRLEILAALDIKEITITFQDSSPGVEENQLSLLFERFFRTDPSRHRAGSGAGLGLGICTNIVKAHQGTITAHHSDIGGLAIRVTLPLNS